MSDKPIRLRAHAAAPKDMVRRALTDTASYRAWWSSSSCVIDRVEGAVEPGGWVIVTSASRDGRLRTYGSQLLELNSDDLTFSWRGRSAEGVRVTLRLDASKDGKTTQIDAIISGAPSARAAAVAKKEWAMILRILGFAWGSTMHER